MGKKSFIDMKDAIGTTLKQAKRLKKSKERFASITDLTDKQLYFILTEEQLIFVLGKKEKKRVPREIQKIIDERLEDLAGFYPPEMLEEVRKEYEEIATGEDKE